jgi:glycosyltransferase involved in cell wall biosynthesis
LVRAFARLQDVDARLVIAGNDMGGGEQAQRIAQELGVARRVLFTGLLTGAARLHALADADVVVYASEHEVFGLVAFEALLAGTPVVVADDSGCGDLVRAAGGGLVVRVNAVDELANAIDEVLARPVDWRQRAERAAVGIRHQCGDDVVCASLEVIYAELITVASSARTPTATTAAEPQGACSA